MTDESGESGESMSVDEANALYERIEERAKSVGMETAREPGWTREEWLCVDYRNGRNSRSVTYPPAEALLLEKEEFEMFHFLGDYEAVIHVGTGEIEARIGTLDSRNPSPPLRLWRLPGAEILGTEGADPDETREATSPFVRPDAGWRLVVRSSDVKIELSPTSTTLARILGVNTERFKRFDTLKVSGFATTGNDPAVKALEGLGSSFLLDLDLRYGQAVGLMMRRRRPMRTSFKQSPAAVAFPKNRYQAEPLALYNYGRSAGGLPLLEYLAYYQVVEYFFTSFANADTLHRVQNVLRDPGFEMHSDISIMRLVAVSQTGRRGGSERDNLRIAVRSSVEASDLISFVTSDQRYTDHFCSKKQAIAGVKALQASDASPDIRDQVADRIYAIRCRVVHTKEEGGESQVDLLLPASREARSLGPDVELMRLIAQKVLIARAAQL